MVQKGKSGTASLIVSIFSVTIAFSALAYSVYTEKSLSTKNEIHNFDIKWVGGTFQCVSYLMSLPPEAKVFAFKGQKHDAPGSSKTLLENCVPKYADEIIALKESNGFINVSSKYAFEAKETVRTSFNALDILIENIDDIDECKAWGSVGGIFKKPETSKIVSHWGQFGNCGPNCFTSVGALIDNGRVSELNKSCS